MKRVVCIMLVIMTGMYLGAGPSRMSAATAAPRAGLFDFFRKKKKNPGLPSLWRKVKQRRKRKRTVRTERLFYPI